MPQRGQMVVRIISRHATPHFRDHQRTTNVTGQKALVRASLQPRCALRIWDLPAPTLELAKAIALLSISSSAKSVDNRSLLKLSPYEATGILRGTLRRSGQECRWRSC